MSINISVVSNKPEFTNFFSNQITLPTNCEVTMVKANLDIPLLVTTEVRVPPVVIGQRAETACFVTIEGIQNQISWTEIYNAHTALNATDIDAGVTADEYFSGNYVYMPNNKLFSTDPVVFEPKTKLDFPTVFAKAIDTNFAFYTVEAQITKTNPDYSRVAVDAEYTSRNFTGLINGSYIENLQTQSWTLVVTYTPNEVANLPTFDTTFAPADNQNWAISAGNNTLTSQILLQNVAWYNGAERISINGGFATTTVNHAGGPGNLMAFGVSFEGTTNITDYIPDIANYSPEVLDVGIEFGEVGGKKVYQIIDGHQKFVYHDGVSEVTTIKPNYYPTLKLLEYGIDAFYLQVNRGNSYNGTTEFVVNIYQGVAGGLITDDTTELIYTGKRTLNAAVISPNIGLLSTPDAGNVFSNNKYIPATTDDEAQHNLSIAFTGGLGIVSLDPVVSETEGGLLSRNFWSAWGLYTDDIDASEDSVFINQNKIDNTMTLKRDVNFSNYNARIRYFLGNQQLSQIFTQAADTNTTVINLATALVNLPKELKVGVNNLPVVSFQGQYNSTNNYAVSSGGETRVIGTIPLPPIDDDTVNIPITYEPFNLTYKPLNNPEPFVFNQLLMEIFYQDYNTNRRKKFGSVNGHLTIDMNIRQGAKPPPVKNNLRAI